MLKYVTTAVALKAFSLSPATRHVYRALGNQVGNRQRRNGLMPDYYVERLKRMLRLVRMHDMVRQGDRILELGTGWLHWEALTLRLFYDVEAVLFDVWDNRQLGGLKNYLHQLDPLLENVGDLSAEQVSRARTLIREVNRVKSFASLYKLLGFEYVVNEAGRLDQLANESFQLVVSAGVLEHVYERSVPTLVAETRRVLRPRGWALHSIDTSDHLSHYDQAMSPKLYLTHSEQLWARVFDNRLQHINRIQRAEWLQLFRENQFQLVDEDCTRVDISKLKLSERFAELGRGDLQCTVIRLALRAA